MVETARSQGRGRRTERACPLLLYANGSSSETVAVVASDSQPLGDSFLLFSSSQRYGPEKLFSLFDTHEDSLQFRMVLFLFPPFFFSSFSFSLAPSPSPFRAWELGRSRFGEDRTDTPTPPVGARTCAPGLGVAAGSATGAPTARSTTNFLVRWDDNARVQYSCSIKFHYTRNPYDHCYMKSYGTVVEIAK